MRKSEMSKLEKGIILKKLEQVIMGIPKTLKQSKERDHSKNIEKASLNQEYSSSSEEKLKLENRKKLEETNRIER